MRAARPIRRLLVANRGEIAVRIVRACRVLGIETVAVFSEADRESRVVRLADEAVLIGAAPARESYLRSDKLLAAAQATGCDAVHPGYGFLSENAAFARAVEDAGLVWVGPPPSAMEAMGSKISSRERMMAAGIPVVPGVHVVGQGPEGAPEKPPEFSSNERGARGAGGAATRATVEADTSTPPFEEILSLGLPVIVKASSGGGGKGMKIVQAIADLSEAISSCSRGALAAFGDGTVYVEKYLERPRHVEVQIFGDREGTVVAIGERECSLQRRHQKVIEESPSPGVTPELRARLCSAAVAAARAVGYVSAGTVEFLLAPDGRFFFLEMNTRIQVEHAVTEEAFGVDLVVLQLRVASGEPLPGDLPSAPTAHAMEARVYAEDAENEFLPQTGRVLFLREPAGPGIRVDSALQEGDEISVYYDPMLARIVARGADREEARRRLAAALGETVIEGVTTNVTYLKRVLELPEVVEGKIDTGLLERITLPPAPDADEATNQAAERGRAGFSSKVNGDRSEGDGISFLDPFAAGGLGLRGFRLLSPGDAASREVRRPPQPYSPSKKIPGASGAPGAPGSSGSPAEHDLLAPMPGKIIRVLVSEGEKVAKGSALLVLEAMKMEHTIRAPHDGVVKRLKLRAGEMVSRGDALAELE